MRIDHVIYATADLDAATARIQADLGLTAVAGGRHDGQGTHNRIVPLADGSYLELLAVADAAEVGRSALGALVQAAIARGDGLLAWAVAVDDVAAVAGRIGTEIVTVGRDGLTGRLTGAADALTEPCLPFFIERTGAAAPPTEPSITWLEVAGDAARLAAWLGGAQLPVRVSPVRRRCARSPSAGGRCGRRPTQLLRWRLSACGRREDQMRVSVTSIAAAAALALAGCGDSGGGGKAKTSSTPLTKTAAAGAPAKYPANVETNFMTNCERTSKGNTKGCRCILDELERTFTLAEFTEEDRAVGAGGAPSKRFTDAVATCR